MDLSTKELKASAKMSEDELLSALTSPKPVKKDKKTKNKFF